MVGSGKVVRFWVLRICTPTNIKNSDRREQTPDKEQAQILTPSSALSQKRSSCLRGIFRNSFPKQKKTIPECGITGKSSN